MLPPSSPPPSSKHLQLGSGQEIIIPGRTDIMERGMGCLGSSSSQKYTLANQSSNATIVKITGTDIRSSNASNNKAVDTTQRMSLVYPQDGSSFSGPSQFSSNPRESPQVSTFGRGDLNAQQFSFDAKPFSFENCRITPRSLTFFCPEICSFIQSLRRMEPDSGTRISSGIENTLRPLAQ